MNLPARPPGPAIPMNYPNSGFAPFPWPHYACYDPCPPGRSQIVGPYVPFPFTPYWRRVSLTQRGNVMSSNDVLNVCPPEAQSGKCKPWWLVRATGRDVVIEDDGESEEFDFPPFSSAPQFSMLKFEVELKEYGEHQTIVRADIGSRLNVSMGPTDLLWGYILVPDVQRYLEEGRPVPSPFDQQDFVAQSRIVSAAIQGSPVSFQARYTQSLFLTNDAGNPQPSFTLDLPPLAKQLQVFRDDTSNPAPTVTYIFKDEISSTLGQILVTDTEGVHEIPQNATQVTVAIDPESPDQIVTLVFLLGY